METTVETTLFERVGVAISGSPRWHQAVGAICGVTERTVRNWNAEPHRIPQAAWSALSDRLHRQVTAASDLQSEITQQALLATSGLPALRRRVAPRGTDRQQVFWKRRPENHDGAAS